jgi:hypothetical protein
LLAVPVYAVTKVVLSHLYRLFLLRWRQKRAEG